jgi:tetratricopeptide (TPR) repeat protein
MFPGLTQGYNVYVVDDSHQDETLRTADPQKERKLAKSLIDSHKYKDAIYHIGRALIYDISAVDILDKLLERCKDPCKQLIYTTRGEIDPYWYERAVFGYIYAKQQKYTEALAELLKSASDKCTVAYFEWVKEWDPEILTESLKQVSIEHLGTVLAAVMKRHKSLNVKDDKLILRSLKALSDVMFESYKYRRAEMDNFTLYGLASLLRKVGNLTDAMTVGLYMDETHSDWYSCLAIAYLYREMHQVDEALKWYQKCHKFHPEDESVLLDAGDTCLDALRIREAGTWYLKAIRKREVPWAIASMCFIDYMMTGHQDYVAELLNASRRNNMRAADLLGPALALFKPFRVSLLLPDEHMVTSLFTLVLDICKPQTRNRGVFGTWVLITLYPPSPISYVAFDVEETHFTRD